MNKDINVWNTDSSVDLLVGKNKSISRGTATYRAYHKMGLLSKDMSEYHLASAFDNAYNEFEDKLIGESEMFIPIKLSADFDIFKLYYAFRDSYSAFEELHPIWYKYEMEEFNIYDPGEKFEVHAMFRNGNDVDGLYFMSKNVEKQIEEAGNLKSDFISQNKGLSIRGMDPAAYIALTAIRLELGEKPVDFVSYTRFISIAPKEVDNKMFVPLARWSGDAMRFGWSSVMSTFGDCGTRYTYFEK